MPRFIAATVLASLALTPAFAQEHVGEVSTTFRVDSVTAIPIAQRTARGGEGDAAAAPDRPG
jgi:hypothetical protein